MGKFLTDRAILAMKPPAKRIEIPDGKIAKLYLLCLPSGVKTWIFRFRLHGKNHSFTIGKYPGIALSTARKAAQDAQAEVDRGINPYEAKKLRLRPPAEITVRAFVARFVNECANVETRASTAKETKRILEQHVVQRWGDRALQFVSDEDCQKMINEVANSYRASAIRLHSAFNVMCDWCVGKKLIKKSPMAGVTHPTVLKSDKRSLSDLELSAVMFAGRRMNSSFGEAVEMLIRTGQRRGEVFGMTWSEVDFRNLVWIIPPARSKNGREHLVPLTDMAKNLLLNLPNSNNLIGSNAYMFPNASNGIISGYSSYKKRLDKEISLELNIDRPWRIHDLRRTVITGLAKIGIKREVRDAVVNHSKDKLDETYNTWDYLEEKKEALERWERYLWALHGFDRKVTAADLRAGK